jgi:hypothetical protein
VPAESSRLRRRIRRRDRWFIAVVACAVLCATAAAVVLSGSPATRDGSCVSLIRPGFMGGQTVTYCGARAVSFCRTRRPGDTAAASACLKQGYAADRAQP